MCMPQFLDRGSYSDRYYTQKDKQAPGRVLASRNKYSVPTGQGVKVDMMEWIVYQLNVFFMVLSYNT